MTEAKIAAWAWTRVRLKEVLDTQHVSELINDGITTHCRSVLNNDDLEILVGLFRETAEKFTDFLRPVVDGDDYAKTWGAHASKITLIKPLSVIRYPLIVRVGLGTGVIGDYKFPTPSTIYSLALSLNLSF